MRTVQYYGQIDLDVLQAFNPGAGLLSTLPRDVSEQADDLDLEVLGSFNRDLVTQGLSDDWPPDIRIPTPCNKKCSDKQKKKCEEDCGEEDGGCIMISWNGGPCKAECACIEKPENEFEALTF